MRNRRLRRMGAGAAMSVVVVLASAGPAFAHFCLKTDFNPTAAAHAGASEAWLTADEWRELLPLIEPDCPGITAAIEPILTEAEASGTTLFMGPGLLAGGTLKNGKGQHATARRVPARRVHSALPQLEAPTFPSRRNEWSCPAATGSPVGEARRWWIVGLPCAFRPEVPGFGRRRLRG